MEQLSKQERRDLAKEQKLVELEVRDRQANMKKYKLWLIVLLVLFGIGFWIYKEMTKPLPGELLSDLGRDHVQDIGDATYNSNPPTSGPHFTVWAKKGVYDRILSDGYLIHSLEHGYIVISYDCTKELIVNRRSFIDVFAHEGDDIPEGEEHPTDNGKPLTQLKFVPPTNTSWFTPENPPSVEIPLPENFQSNECKNLVSQLKPFAEKGERVVVVPRPNMDTPIALTAWRRLQKLESFDEKKIEYFIKSYHNLGPEKTME